jgi:hypothetical protein
MGGQHHQEEPDMELQKDAWVRTETGELGKVVLD